MIRELFMMNTGPFRGEHRIALGPKAYAITARYAADPGRSNWGGKSWLVEMIDFALTGKTKKSRRLDADGWLTHDERVGSVALTLEDGATIERSRIRGKATQVRFTDASGRVYAQDAASDAVLAHLAFDADDFRRIAYFESKAMARLIHTDPSEREETMRGWLGLAKIDACEESAQSIVRDRVAAAAKLRETRSFYVTQLNALGVVNPLEAAEMLTRYEAARDAATSTMMSVGARRSKMQASAREVTAARDVVEEFDRLIAEGKERAAFIATLPSAAQLDADFEQLEREMPKQTEALALAKREVANRKVAALGQFDGVCPVAKLACPATKTINGMREENTRALREAEAKRNEVQTNHDVTLAAFSECRAQRDMAVRKREKLAEIKQRAEELKPKVKAARALLRTEHGDDALFDALDGEYNDAKRALEEAQENITTLKAASAQRAKIEKAIADIDAQLTALTRDATIAIKARDVVRSAQRRVAERSLAAISTRASSMLQGAGIDLEVAVRWEYEGKNLARACDDCGAAFPASAKIKQCTACGAERGMNVIRRLDFTRSDQSDAADDLAGVSLQLAAGSWLLAKRSSPWACAILDEPLAACDKTNRRAISQQLVRLLGLGTWRQALVISHSTDTIDAFPARLEVIVERDGTRRIEQT